MGFPIPEAEFWFDTSENTGAEIEPETEYWSDMSQNVMPEPGAEENWSRGQSAPKRWLASAVCDEGPKFEDIGSSVSMWEANFICFALLEHDADLRSTTFLIMGIIRQQLKHWLLFVNKLRS